MTTRFFFLYHKVFATKCVRHVVLFLFLDIYHEVFATRRMVVSGGEEEGGASGEGVCQVEACVRWREGGSNEGVCLTKGRRCVR